MNTYKLGSIGALIAGINHIVLLSLVINIVRLITSPTPIDMNTILSNVFLSIILVIIFLTTIIGHILFYVSMMKFSKEFDESNTIKTAGVIGVIGSALFPIFIGFALEGIALAMIGVTLYSLMKETEIRNRIGENYAKLGIIVAVIGTVGGITKITLVGSIIGIPVSIFFYLPMALILYKL